MKREVQYIKKTHALNCFCTLELESSLTSMIRVSIENIAIRRLEKRKERK